MSGFQTLSFVGGVGDFRKGFPLFSLPLYVNESEKIVPNNKPILDLLLSRKKHQNYKQDGTYLLVNPPGTNICTLTHRVQYESLKAET